MFTHDTEIALRNAAALVNTAPQVGLREEELPDPTALDAFLTAWSWTGSRTHDQAELAAVHRVRPLLRRVWELADDLPALAAHLNEILARARALPQLVDHDGYGWHIHAVAADEPVATRMAVEAAMALIDIIRAGETSRLKRCAAPDCDGVLIDLSRNRSRRYCEGGCGDRLAAAAYRARRAK